VAAERSCASLWEIGKHTRGCDHMCKYWGPHRDKNLRSMWKIVKHVDLLHVCGRENLPEES